MKAQCNDGNMEILVELPKAGLYQLSFQANSNVTKMNGTAQLIPIKCENCANGGTCQVSDQLRFGLLLRSTVAIVTHIDGCVFEWR